MASFLSRIERAADPLSNERYTSRDGDVESAVTQHLARMLNTRQGSALTCPDYGLIEVSEVLYDFPDAIGIMQRALKNTIQTYEPRLKNVQVRHLKSEAGGEMTLAVRDHGAAPAPRRAPAGPALLHGASTAAATSRCSSRPGFARRSAAEKRDVDTVRRGGSTALLGDARLAARGMFNKYYQDELTYLRELGREFASGVPGDRPDAGRARATPTWSACSRASPS